MTEHPISKPQEWAKTNDILEKGDVQSEFMEKQMSKKPNLRSKMSTQTEIIIPPQVTMTFGEGGEYNEEQGEYCYRSFGGYAEDRAGKEVKPWIIEVDENGKEVKGIGSFYNQYRVKNATQIRSEGKIEQFVIPNAKA